MYSGRREDKMLSNFKRGMGFLTVLCVLCILSTSRAQQQQAPPNVSPPLTDTPVSVFTIPGYAKDLYTGETGVNGNRLGGFGSDLSYSRSDDTFYGLADRGPGGGVYSYSNRLQKYKLDIDKDTGEIKNFALTQTIPFFLPAGSTLNGVTVSKDTNFNGLDPERLNGDPSVQGLSLDSEGLALSPSGNFYVSDEYGPSIYEFDSNGKFLRQFETPELLKPKDQSGAINYVKEDDELATGRQYNRGFEALTASLDGAYLYAALQSPLTQEGPEGNGQLGRSVRIVEFDISSGKAVAQYIYQLDSLTEINALTEPSFEPTEQGTEFGVNALYTLADGQILVLERDGRGVGVDPSAFPAHKRIYKIDLSGASNVDYGVFETNTLPDYVVPLKKELWFDIHANLYHNGLPIPEKFEGLTIGPQLNNGKYVLVIATDNDFSVTQNDSDEQEDVYLPASLPVATVLSADYPKVAPLDGACDACVEGDQLLPSFIYSWQTS